MISELGDELQVVVRCAEEGVELLIARGRSNVEELSDLSVEGSHTILRHREADEVQLVDSKLRFVEVDRRTILSEPSQNSIELRNVGSMVRCDHNDIIEMIRKDVTVSDHVADDLREAGRR